MITLRCCVPALLLAVAPGLPAQATATLIADRDNTLYEDPGGALSNGVGAYLFVGVTNQPGIRRTLLRFDVAGAVPPGSRILSASLRLNVSRSYLSTPIPVGAHRVQADWGEAGSNGTGNEGNGTPAQAGDATWLHTFFPTATWTLPGGDFAGTPSSTASMPAAGASTWASTQALVADTQTFLDQPALNFGWVLVAANEQAVGDVRRMDSRQHTTSSRRPRLTITWLPPGQAIPVGTGCPGGTGLPLVLQAQNQPGPTFGLLLSGGQPLALSANAVGLGLAATPQPVYPGCSFLLDPSLRVVTHNLLLLDTAGAATTPFPFPPGFRGVEVDFQSFAVDSGAPAGFVLSNALRTVAW